MGFVGTWRVGNWFTRAAAMALGLALVVPGHGLAATPVASATGIHGTVPDLTPAAGRTIPGAAWIVVLKPSALSSSGGSGPISLDTTAATTGSWRNAAT